MSFFGALHSPHGLVNCGAAAVQPQPSITVCTRLP
jgi:hypothetical protein